MAAASSIIRPAHQYELNVASTDPHGAHAFRLFGFWHEKRLQEAIGRVVEVVGIHDHRTVELSCGAREPAQHQYAELVGPGSDELLGDQVHAVVQAADVTDVRGAEQLEDVRWLVVGLEPHDRSILAIGEPRVDARNRLPHLSTELAVGWQGTPGRFGHLRQHARPRYAGSRSNRRSSARHFSTSPLV